MKLRRVALCLALWSSAAEGQAPAAPAERLLRLRFRPSSRARYASRSVHSATVAGRVATAETRVSFTLETSSVSADGVAARSLTVTDATLRAEALAPAVRARVLRGLRSAAVRYRESERGEVRERAVAAADDPELRDVLGTLTSGFDAYLPVLPEGPVAVGSRWRGTRSLDGAPLPGVRLSLRCEAEYALRELRADGVAVIAVRVQLASSPGATLAGVPLRAEGSAEGEAVLDLHRGLVRGARMRGELLARLTVRGQEVTLPSRFEDELRLESEPPP